MKMYNYGNTGKKKAFEEKIKKMESKAKSDHVQRMILEEIKENQSHRMNNDLIEYLASKERFTFQYVSRVKRNL